MRIEELRSHRKVVREKNHHDGYPQQELQHKQEDQRIKLDGHRRYKSSRSCLKECYQVLFFCILCKISSAAVNFNHIGSSVQQYTVPSEAIGLNITMAG